MIRRYVACTSHAKSLLAKQRTVLTKSVNMLSYNSSETVVSTLIALCSELHSCVLTSLQA